MPLRGRDVEHVFRNRGAEAGAKYCIQMIADEQSQLRQMIMECASAIDQLAELSTMVAMEVGNAPTTKSQRKPLVQAMEAAMGRNIDAPEVNLHDKHNDEGAVTDPDKTGD